MRRKVIRRKTAIRKNVIRKNVTRKKVNRGHVRKKRPLPKRSSLRRNGKRNNSNHRNAAQRTIDHAAILADQAYSAGKSEAMVDSLPNEMNLKACVNQLWAKHAPRPHNKISWDTYHAAARKFLEGFSQQAGIKPANWVLAPKEHTVAVIMAVMNEDRTITAVLEQLERLPLDEIIIVVNGSKDESFRKARESTKATIIRYPKPLGHDVGRAVGAKIAQSDILLFLDGDFSISAEQLVPFILSIDQGADIALNDISPYLQLFGSRDAVSIMKQFLNKALGRPDLNANSLTAVPHALSRKALEAIGYKNLLVPPKAQAIAIQQKLVINTPASVNVIEKNRIRDINIGQSNLVSKMIVGDHIEAIKVVIEGREVNRGNAG